MKPFLPVIFVLASIGIAYLYVYPQYQKIDQLKIDEAVYDDALKKVAKIEDVKAQLMADLGRIDPVDMVRLNTMIREERAPLLITLYLEELAEDNDVTLTTLSVGSSGENNNDSTGSRAPAGVRPVTTSLSFTETYQGMLDFIRIIEKNLEVSDIVSLNVSTAEREEGVVEDRYDVNLTIQTYLQQ